MCSEGHTVFFLGLSGEVFFLVVGFFGGGVSFVLNLHFNATFMSMV